MYFSIEKKTSSGMLAPVDGKYDIMVMRMGDWGWDEDGRLTGNWISWYTELSASGSELSFLEIGASQGRVATCIPALRCSFVSSRHKSIRRMVGFSIMRHMNLFQTKVGT